MDTNTSGAASAAPAANPYLESGPRHNPSDMRVRSGYPIWNLIDGWMGAGYDDEAMIRDYKLDPAEWAAAKQYYLDHKPMIDARIIMNLQPEDDDDVPPMRSVADFFAWVAQVNGRTVPDGMHE